MNDDSRCFSHELSQIPCPLCRYSMRLKLSLRLLMAQYKHLCEHCKDKISFIDKKCICKEKTRAPVISVDQEEQELYRRIKNFYKSIVPSPRLIHKTKILPLLDEYNPFRSLSAPNFSEYDTKGRQMTIADSEPNLSLGRPSDDSRRQYDQTGTKEDFQKTRSKCQVGDEDDHKYGAAKDREYGAGRDREYGARRDSEYGAGRDGKYGAGKDREHSSGRDGEHGAGRDGKYGAGKDREHSAGRDGEHGADRDATKDVTSSEAQKHTAGKKAIDSTVDRSTKKIERDGDVSRAYKGKRSDEVQAAKEKYGDKDTGKKSERGKSVAEGKEKYADREKEVVEGKVKKPKDAFKEKSTIREKEVSEGKGKKGKDPTDDKEKKEKEKYADREKEVVEGKVKKPKDAFKEKSTIREKEVSEGKGKKGKDPIDDKEKKEKEKYADREKEVVEGKVKKPKDAFKEKSTIREKEVSEGKGKKGKDPIDDKEKKEKDGDGTVKDKEDEKGRKKRDKDTDMDMEPIGRKKDKNEIDLDIMSFGERRQLSKKKGEAHKKKTVLKGKQHDKDEKESKHTPKSERSGVERGPDKDQGKVKKKNEIDDDLATPLTYTEKTDRTARNPFLRQGGGTKKAKKKSKIGKISDESSNKIITPAVKPKILELIKKLLKTPRIRDNYSERISSRTSRYITLDDVSDTPPEPSFLDLRNTPSPRKFHSCIVGNRIINYKLPMPKFSEVEEYSISVKPHVYVKYEEKPPQISKNLKEPGDDEAQNDMGVLCYALSNRSFISKGYTILPTEKIMRKLNVYRMRPSNPHNNWFVRNRRKKRLNYDSGQKLAVFDGDERCRIYYKNGNVALEYYQAEDRQAQERIVIYSDGENECKQKVPVTVLATFDHMGTGVIFDMKGNIRAKYNQNEGVVLDKTLGPYTKWKWHELNDPPVLEQVMMETVLPEKDPRILRQYSQGQLPRVVDEKILEIEFQNSLREKGKKIFKSFKPFPIKIKAFKINDQFSLHITDQTKIHLTFRDGPTSFRIDVGMILDCNEIIDMETTELGEVDIPMERKPARSTSVHNLQRTVEQAKLLARNRQSRMQRQRPTVQPCRSFERMREAISPPPRVHLQGTNQTVFPCSCKKSSI